MHPASCWKKASPNSAPGMNRRGFTLIEIIVVLILVAILAAVAIPRVMDNTANEVAAANTLKGHLRFAQMQALNSGTSWGIVSTGNGYSLFTGGVITDTRLLPGENDLVINPPRVTMPAFTRSFDGWGQPYIVPDPYEKSEDGKKVATPETKSEALKIIIGTRTIAITPETGFIP